MCETNPMFNSKIVILFLSFYFVTGIKAQEVDNTLLPISIGVQPYFKATYENDLFRTEDFGNTQNIYLEYAHPALNTFFLKKLFPKLNTATSITGLALEHNVYTPQNLASSVIQNDDYPYASALMLRYFTVRLDTVNHLRLSANIDAGVIGPLAGGKQMQITIHRTTGDVIPQGWDYQIANDVILNYDVNIDKQLLYLPSYLLLSAEAGVQVGSLKTNAKIGLNVMVGFFDNPFENRVTNRKKKQAYFYNTVQFYGIAYNATLQGGLLNNGSVYAIESNNIERFQLKNIFGIGLNFGSYTVSYYNIMYTKPFAKASTKLSGGLTLGKRF